MKIYRLVSYCLEFISFKNIIPNYPKYHYTTSLLVDNISLLPSHIHNNKHFQSFICHTEYTYLYNITTITKPT